MVAIATNILSLVTNNSGVVATLTTRFLYDLDLKRVKLKQTFHPGSCIAFVIKNVPNLINKASLPPNL